MDSGSAYFSERTRFISEFLTRKNCFQKVSKDKYCFDTFRVPYVRQCRQYSCTCFRSNFSSRFWSRIKLKRNSVGRTSSTIYLAAVTLPLSTVAQEQRDCGSCQFIPGAEGPDRLTARLGNLFQPKRIRPPVNVGAAHTWRWACAFCCEGGYCSRIVNESEAVRNGISGYLPPK